MTDKVETNLKQQITRLRNVAKNKPMLLVEKLLIHERIKEYQGELLRHRMARYDDSMRVALMDMKRLNDLVEKMAENNTWPTKTTPTKPARRN